MAFVRPRRKRKLAELKKSQRATEAVQAQLCGALGEKPEGWEDLEVSNGFPYLFSWMAYDGFMMGYDGFIYFYLSI